MGVISGALGLLAKAMLGEFERASAEPVRAQEKVLRSLVTSAAATEWGRGVGLGEVRNLEDLRQRVAITRYEDAAPLWHRAFEGACDVTWPGHVDYFALSSGTTAGNKLLPVTKAAIASNVRAGKILAALMVRRGGMQDLAGGKYVYLGGSTTLRQRGQSLYGDASGIMSRHIPFYARRRHLPEPDIAALTDWDEKISAIIRRYLAGDIRVLSGCPSWVALLFKQLLRETAARGLPARHIGELWPRLAFFISYGMAFDPYRPAFDEFIGRRVHYFDTYSSSEGGLTAIQEEAAGPMRLLVDNGVFFEFVPADQMAAPQPPRLHLGEVQEGVDYAVILSTNGGIWAYPLGDIIRFVSLRPPRIVFAGRTQMMLSAFGEHVTLEMIEQAVAAACRRTAASVADYTIEALYPGPGREKPGHRWLVEFDRAPADAAAFMDTIDRSIRAENEDYDTHRHADFGMTGPELQTLAPGTFYTWMKDHGKLGGQHKVPRIAKGEMAHELLQISAHA